MKSPLPLVLLLLALGGAVVSLHADDALKKALVMSVSFDKGFDADFSTGETACYLKSGGELVPCVESDDLKLVPDGKFGGAIHFPRKGTARPTFRGDGVLGYNAEDWSATVSLWMRLTPDEDLEPGYCDPIQIVGDTTKKGFIFLEWSKDHSPRYFRYAIRPLIELWDPEGLGWEVLPEAKRPMVQLKKTPFSRDRWTHAVFTLNRVNAGKEKSSGALYLDGTLQGEIKGHDLTFGWDPKAVMLVLGAAYVGHIDDLAVFNRALDDDEVARLHALENGVADLRP
ncbi:MAG: LamG domain-containing protein [Verrucomicrobiaceae bacterium]|nr:LamG domain-containing protein [Verrucomicrobiaceae bacterium]